MFTGGLIKPKRGDKDYKKKLLAYNREICKRKAAYDTEDEAITASLLYQAVCRNKGGKRAYTYYFCYICHKYHLTTH